MQENLKPLPENISKEKIGQIPKNASFDPFADSPMSKAIHECVVKVNEKFDEEIFGICNQILTESGVKSEFVLNKDFIVNAVKKATASKPLFIVGDYDLPICPECKQMVDYVEKSRPEYCSECGQKLDWSDEDEPTTTDFEACQTDFD
jgi:hypothetical protein